ncbi:MATE family efflux transporter [Alteraurantiacibacter aquimixticola]|uniref:MATE family efflux transporter n=2 Tax=Alteraurantiacibacter aquimixticola TaxID=2489173 RepID=A0A4T3F159_9SPHN|nr:MATE family efflux transporter [Alteraurantiacibacter aquimixticola]
MLGQASIPLVGVVDATVIGRTGDTAGLAGVALGATIITLIFWSFGFLRMGVTGLTAQAQGAGDRREVEALLLRALLLGFGLGLAILVLQWPLREAAFALLAGGEGVTSEASAYVTARFLGAPAALSVFAINGWLLGLGKTRAALALQVLMNVVNIAADIFFVWQLDMGAQGVGLGTALAEWSALLAGLVIAGRVAGGGIFATVARTPRSAITDRAAIRRLFAVNRDIMIRTLALLAIFTWFANAGARLGAKELAANHVLMQFINLAAFVLDAFAFTAESRVGNAIGARDKAYFLRSVRLAGEFSLASGVLLSLLFLALGGAVIDFISTDPQVRAEAARFLPFAALVPLLGMPSWMLDGIFIGATRGHALRNAAVLATALYLALDLALRGQGNLGVWIAISASYLLRAGALGLYLPALLRDVESGSAARHLDEGGAEGAQ